MTVAEIVSLISEVFKILGRPETKDSIWTFAIITFVVLTAVQISKIKLNPWSWLAKQVGRAINKEIMDEIKGLHSEIDDVRAEQRVREADLMKERALQARRRILAAADEVRRGIGHSDEFFTEALADVDEYEKYCSEHPDFENSKAENSIALIKEEHLLTIKENKLV